MKLLLDHNLSQKLLLDLEKLYPDSEHVANLGLDSAKDTTVWEYARERGMIITSKDSDFYHRSMVLGHPPKVVWLKLGNCPTSKVRDVLTSSHERLLAFEQDANASLLILP